MMAWNAFFSWARGGVQFLTQPAIEIARNATVFPSVIGIFGASCFRSTRRVGRKGACHPSVIVRNDQGKRAASGILEKEGRQNALAHRSQGYALGLDADYNFTNFAEDDTSSESFYLQTLLIVLALLAERGEFEDFDDTVSELKRLPELLASVKEDFETSAAALAQEIKDEKYHIFTGAGTAWPEAHYYGMCILEEMQWIRTRPVHASDFFHGTLELVEPGVSLFIFKGEDACRPLTDRLENFAKRYTDKVRILDAASASLPGISQKTRSLISPIILATMLERLSAHLEVLRDHPLTTRRYYKRVEY
jgi:fructoselysine-6-phosphate deglycase